MKPDKMYLTVEEFKAKIRGTSLAQTDATRDFLATCSNVGIIYETATYYLKKVKMMGNKELRLWKKSKRVTLSVKHTSKSLYIAVGGE